MTPTKNLASTLSSLVELEEQLADLLNQMSYDVEHIDSFDREQRAEIHTILRAVQADTQMHRGMVSLLARGGEYVSDV